MKVYHVTFNYRLKQPRWGKGRGKAYRWKIFNLDRAVVCQSRSDVRETLLNSFGSNKDSVDLKIISKEEVKIKDKEQQ